MVIDNTVFFTLHNNIVILSEDKKSTSTSKIIIYPTIDKFTKS